MAQILGILGFCLSIISFQQNEHKKIVLLQFTANICFTAHFILLQAYTGALLNFIGFLRSIVFLFKDKKWARSNLWILFFSALCIAGVIFVWEGKISVIPMVAMVLTTVAFGIDNPRLTRLLAFPSSPLWLIYNVINKSYGGILTEVFNMASIFVGMLRFDKNKSKEV